MKNWLGRTPRTVGDWLGQALGTALIDGGVAQLPALAAAFCLAKPMAAYQMGEAYARSVGVDVRRFSRLLVLLSSLLAACVTAFAGPISFVGIAVPHLVKQLLGSARPLYVLPGCCLGGAAFCLLCDLIARSLFAPMELSIGAVTAVFGAPAGIGRLLRRNREDVRGSTLLKPTPLPSATAKLPLPGISRRALPKCRRWRSLARTARANPPCSKTWPGSWPLWAARCCWTGRSLPAFPAMPGRKSWR